MSRGAFVFPAKGRDGGLSALFCLFELFKFCREAVGSPPPNLFNVTQFTSSIRRVGGAAAPRALHSCALLLPHVQVRLRAHLCCLYFDRILEDIPLKKKRNKKKKTRARWQLTVLRKLWKTMRNMKCIVMVIFSYIL